MKKLFYILAFGLIAPPALAGGTSTVPEPSTWALFGAAAIAVYLIGKFKK